MSRGWGGSNREEELYRQRNYNESHNPWRCATAVGVVRSAADEYGTPTTPAVALGLGIPSSSE